MESSLATIGHQMKSCNCNEEAGTESRLENIISMEVRNSCRCNFEATSVVSVADCDRHNRYIHINKCDSVVKISCLTFWLSSHSR